MQQGHFSRDRRAVSYHIHALTASTVADDGRHQACVSHVLHLNNAVFTFVKLILLLTFLVATVAPIMPRNWVLVEAIDRFNNLTFEL